MICAASPVGPLGADAEGDAVTRLLWGASGRLTAGALYDQLRAEWAAYFAGTVTTFTVPLAPKCSPFQQRFHAALCAIPYGETRSYGDLANLLGVSAQAIGQACGALQALYAAAAGGELDDAIAVITKR